MQFAGSTVVAPTLTTFVITEPPSDGSGAADDDGGVLWGSMKEVTEITLVTEVTPPVVSGIFSRTFWSLEGIALKCAYWTGTESMGNPVFFLGLRS